MKSGAPADLDTRIQQLKRSIASGQDAEIEYEKHLALRTATWRDTKKDDEEDVNLYVFSKMRDMIARPNSTSSDYQIKLSTPLQNVVQVQLLAGSFPLNIDLIDSTNQSFTFGTPDTKTVYVATLTPGRYDGPGLAAELTRRMNEQVCADQITGNKGVMNPNTGFVAASSSDPGLIQGQFLVTFHAVDQGFTFQTVDGTGTPTNTAFTISFPDDSGQSNLARILGFNGLSQSSDVSTTYINNQLVRTISNAKPSSFGTGLAPNLDSRRQYGLSSTNSADLLGENIMCIDIPEFRNNDIVMVNSPNTGVSLHDCLGYVSLPVGKKSESFQLDFSSGGHPIKKIFRDAIQVNTLTIQLKRPDGQFMKFRGGEHFFMLRVTQRIRRNETSIASR